jgi:hypothetical protein
MISHRIRSRRYLFPMTTVLVVVSAGVSWGATRARFSAPPGSAPGGAAARIRGEYPREHLPAPAASRQLDSSSFVYLDDEFEPTEQIRIDGYLVRPFRLQTVVYYYGGRFHRDQPHVLATPRAYVVTFPPA